MDDVKCVSCASIATRPGKGLSGSCPPGFCDEVLHLYLASDLKPTSREPQQDEVIEVHWLPLDDAAAMALDGRIQDSKTIAGLLRARHRLRETSSP